MASKNVNPAQAKEALNQIKMEAANEVGVTLNQNYNGDLTAAQAGKIGGQMVKMIIENFENQGQVPQNQNQNQSQNQNQNQSSNQNDSQAENSQNNNGQRNKKSK